MSITNERDKDKMGLLAPGRSSEIDHAIAAAELAIVNTEKFLNEVKNSQESAREYVEGVRSRIEMQLAELRSRKEFLLKESQRE